MDDYLSKPVDAERLAQVVRRWVASVGPSTASGTPEPGGGDDGLDPTTLAGLRELAADSGPELLTELVEMFLRDAGTRVAELRSAAVAGDGERLRSAAHALKGSAGNLAARRLADTAALLEARGSEGRVDGAASLVDALEHELQRLRVVLPAVLAVPAGA